MQLFWVGKPEQKEGKKKKQNYTIRIFISGLKRSMTFQIRKAEAVATEERYMKMVSN